MSDTDPIAAQPPKQVAIYKGRHNVLAGSAGSTPNDALAIVRRDVADAMNSKHLSFLLGSGCSSSWNGSKELGIPTMGPLAKAFLTSGAVSEDKKAELKKTLGLDLQDPAFSNNLERLMEVLYGFRFTLEQVENHTLAAALPLVNEVISAVKLHVLKVCITGQTDDSDGTVLKTYERFYRRLSQRDKNLARPWIFTTNYDLFNELAMDRLSIPYINGFQGSIERRFNPSTFRYTIAEQMNISQHRWSSVESLLYFAKLHGSLSWQSTRDGLFPVVESWPHESELKLDTLLIYPTPAKQNASFASPYSDMFRELQSRVAREQSALITIGYGFGDEHVNNIIFQALTIPTFRLVAFVDPDASPLVRQLRELDDPRIWIIGTEESTAEWKAHYFVNFVDDIMPSLGEDPTDSAIENLLRSIIQSNPKEQN
ncbi:hypothetical protein QFZ62_003015 [Clavibacter sp. B3I6]|uniref:SIR2 family protein n=1 Tax=Clavibacter sp. B3I6 TaxID=3042268 RepID=UPI00278A3648|nr:SIR2 family protein [Clavibacter sp. B3I6]MDQ0745707.1 hypothetical protein [Clavibacter sp. B3I6]